MWPRRLKHFCLNVGPIGPLRPTLSQRSPWGPMAKILFESRSLWSFWAHGTQAPRAHVLRVGPVGRFWQFGPPGTHKAQDPAYLFLNVGPFLPFRWPFGPEAPMGAHGSQGPWGACPNINNLNVVPFGPLVPLGPGATLGTSPKTHSLELLSLYPWAPCDLAPKPVFSVGPFGPFGTKGPDGLMGPCPKNVFLLNACPFESLGTVVPTMVHRPENVFV